MFLNCKEIKQISFDKLESKNIQSMSQMFKGCSTLREINFNDFEAINKQIVDDDEKDSKLIKEKIDEKINHFLEDE